MTNGFMERIGIWGVVSFEYLLYGLLELVCKVLNMIIKEKRYIEQFSMTINWHLSEKRLHILSDVCYWLTSLASYIKHDLINSK